MKIINHGEWTRYTPSVPNPNAPANTIYVRRSSDGVDWYHFVQGGFQEDTVKMMCSFQSDEWIVDSAVFDGDRLFPAERMVLEIEGYSGTDPAKDFNGKAYGSKTKTFNPRKEVKVE